jgi:hypothetical protein
MDGCRRDGACDAEERAHRDFMAEPLLTSTQRKRASDFCRGRDGAFWRRVNSLLAKNRARGNGMGVDGGG